MITSSAIGGVAVGSLLGGVIISRGRWFPILVFNWISIIGSLISIIDHFTIICIGRFIFGFAAGVLLTAAPKILEETVPEHLQEFGFGASTNIAVMFSVMINTMMGDWIP